MAAHGPNPAANVPELSEVCGAILLHGQDLFPLPSPPLPAATVSMLSCTVIDFKMRCFSFPALSYHLKLI